MARDLLHQCKAPALATLLGRGNSANQSASYDAFSRSLPHEHWLSHRFGLVSHTEDDQDERGNSPPAAAPLLHSHDPQHAQGHWFVLQPVHLQVARDHLVLTDIDQLLIEELDARRLFQSAQALCEASGHRLIYIDPTIWLMRADDWAGLYTASPQVASGRNIDIWMPVGAGASAWRKLQNEVQMQWFSEALNEAREIRGQKPINALWLWGGANAALTATNSIYTATFNLRGWAQALADATITAANATDMVGTTGERGLLMLDTLLEPALNNEWGCWLERMETLERSWFTPLLQTLRERRMQSLSLVLSGQDRLLYITVTASSLRKFWAQPSLSKLAT